MKLAELEKEIAKKHVRPAYLLLGAEPLLRDEAMKRIRTAVLDPSSADFNLDRLHGESASAAVLEDSLRVLPVMAARRLVILTEPEQMRGEASKPLTEALAREVADCADWQETVLVVVASKADRRSRWVKAFQDPAASVDCKPPQAGKALLPFIESEAARQDIVLETGAAQVLAERLGPQLMLIRQELAKVRLFAGEGEPVTRDHVLASAHDVAEKSIWDLTDAIGAGRTAEAISQLGDLMGSGAAGPAILGALAGHFRRLARVREGQPVSVPPFIKRKLESQAKRYSLLGLRHCLEAIHGADLAIKGAGHLSPEVALESLVLDLTQ
ncbi:MAG: DNA polymerase III subunit delta [Myxococcota bacterium]|nr:DNA polymerase III subunit delta [Myxococcota bacterium]